MSAVGEGGEGGGGSVGRQLVATGGGGEGEGGGGGRVKMGRKGWGGRESKNERRGRDGSRKDKVLLSPGKEKASERKGGRE